MWKLLIALVFVTAVSAFADVGTRRACEGKLAQLSYTIENVGFEGIAKLAEMIQKKCPAEFCVVVAPGRSLYAATMFLNMLNPGSAYDVPMSYNRRVIPQAAQLRNRGGLERDFVAAQEIKLQPYSRSTETREQLFAHLDQYFPSPEKIAGRMVMLVDFSHSGFSLKNFAADVEAYKEARGLNFKSQVMHVGFSKDIDLAGEPELQQLLVAESLKPWAPYGSFEIGKSSQANHIQYEKFKAAMAEDFQNWRKNNNSSDDGQRL